RAWHLTRPLFLCMMRRAPRSTLFPYTTLFRSRPSRGGRGCRAGGPALSARCSRAAARCTPPRRRRAGCAPTTTTANARRCRCGGGRRSPTTRTPLGASTCGRVRPPAAAPLRRSWRRCGRTWASARDVPALVAGLAVLITPQEGLDHVRNDRSRDGACRARAARRAPGGPAGQAAGDLRRRVRGQAPQGGGQVPHG